MPYNDFEEKVFQLTPSRRATINPAITLATTLFQLTPSRRATSTLPSSSVIPVFQLTPSRRATTLRKSGAWNCEDFNSRPHGGRLLIEREESCRYISTHALTEGDRRSSMCMPQRRSFQLTPSRRATAIYDGTALFGSFQLTPSRRATILRIWHAEFFIISTHALTEGDCKFRQIFLLNRGYAYSISLYFLPHFISLLPQILSFQQKPFKFQVRIFLLFSVHLAFALQNQCVHHVKSRFCTNMFYFVFVLFTQIVKSQTISLFIYDFF